MVPNKKYGSIRFAVARPVVAVVVVMVTLLASQNVARAADSDLDANFGAGGMFYFNYGAQTVDQTYSTRFAPDGKVVVCGTTRNPSQDVFNRFVIVRLLANGTFDQSFNGSGAWAYDFNNGTGPSQCQALAVQADSRILALVTGTNLSALIRMNADGTQDSSFGTVSLGTLAGSAVTVQADGKILVAGRISDDAAVTRINTDGTLDTSFGTNGVARLILNPEYNELYNHVTVQSDGKIVLTGQTNNVRDNNFAWTYDVLTVRLNSDGTRDSGFGTNGVVQTFIGNDGQGNSVGDDFARAVALQADGKIVVAGYYDNGNDLDIFVLRYGTTGVLDASFGTGGVTLISLTNRNEKANRVHLQSDGKIMVTGMSDSGPAGQYSSVHVGVFVRLNPDGSIDNGFGSNGVATLQLTESIAGAFMPESDQGPDGSFILATVTDRTSNPGPNQVVARIMGLSTPSTTTSTTTTIVVSASPSTTQASNPPTTAVSDDAVEQSETLPQTGSTMFAMLLAGLATVVVGTSIRRRTHN